MRSYLIKIIFITVLSILPFFNCRKKENHPPYTPYTPIGPVSGVINIPYEFSSIATDPDDDNVAIRFDCGTGDTSDWSQWVETEEPVKISFSWSLPDTYYIKAQAKDKNEESTEWSLATSIIIKPNQIPNIPATPVGPLNGFTKISYQFLSSAIDPDSDDVAIRFDWGNGEISGWSGWVGSGDSVWMFTWWLSPDTYDIKVQAKDKHGAISNWSLPISIAIIEREIRGLTWICVTDSAAWSPRESHTSVVFDNKMWVIGGCGCPDQVWSSPDGINWTCVTHTAGFGERDDSKAVVFDNKIWVIGGGHANIVNDVWYSSDGLNWTQVTDSTQWSPRGDHAAVVFNNKIWILGGTDYSNWLYNDVWFSADGINWTCATNSAEWSPRQNLTSVVFDNKIWIMGGERSGSGSNDVWYSTDGRDWSRATASAEWLERSMHTSVVFDNKMWVIGGRIGYSGSNDVWYSSDGRSWILEGTCYMIKFRSRYDHTAVVFDNKIWVMGGFGAGHGGLLNDVWYRTIIEKK